MSDTNETYCTTGIYEGLKPIDPQDMRAMRTDGRPDGRDLGTVVLKDHDAEKVRRYKVMRDAPGATRLLERH